MSIWNQTMNKCNFAAFISYYVPRVVYGIIITNVSVYHMFALFLFKLLMLLLVYFTFNVFQFRSCYLSTHWSVRMFLCTTNEYYIEYEHWIQTFGERALFIIFAIINHKQTSARASAAAAAACMCFYSFHFC